MPSFYTHYNFGKSVVPALSSNIRNIISQNEELFVFGNQGPDLFFFHIISALKGFNLGEDMHNLKFKYIVDKVRYNLLKLGVHSPSNSYFLGLCCNFLLDSTLYPTVNSISNENYTHLDIESELDRYFMRKNGEDEYKISLNKLIPKSDLAEFIYPVYAWNSDTSKELIAKSMDDMKTVKKIFQARGSKKEKFILKVLKLIKMNELSGQLIRQEKFVESESSNEILNELYEKAFKRAPEFLDEVFSYVYEGGEAPEEFGKDMNGV